MTIRPTALLAALLVATPLAAQRLDLLHPRGARPGQELTVTAYGRALDDTAGALFFRPGLELLGVETVDERSDRVVLRLRVADDCPLGRHPVLLHTARGHTRVDTFHVGPLESVTEADDNDSFDAAQLVPLERTIDGRLLREEDDWYAFDVAAGQRVVFEAEALRLGDADIDVELELYDGDGALLHRADDSAFGRSDPVFAWTFETAMRARLRVRDIAWRGSSLFHYRLHVGTFPRPIGALPVGGPRGERIEVELIEPDGRRVPATVDVPDHLGSAEVFPAVDGRTPPTALPFAASAARSIVEGAEPEQAPEPPVAFHGVLAEAREEDRFRVALAKGQRVTVRSVARLFRSPVDAVIYVRDADGKVLAGNDDSGGPDGRIRFRAPADGEYQVCIRDHLRRGGPTWFHRLEVFADGDTVALRESVPGRREEDFGAAVPRGGRAATVIAARGLPRDADFELGWDGLPAGVRAVAPPFTGGGGVVPVVFEAAADAPLGGALASPVALHGGDAAPQPLPFAHTLPLIRIRNNRVVAEVRAEALPVTVGGPAPFCIEVDPPELPVIRGSNARLPFRIVRDEGFDATVSVRMLWKPRNVSAGTAAVRANQDGGTLSISARGNAPVGAFPAVLVASARTGRDVVREVASAVVPFEVAEPWLRIAGQKLRGEQGETLGMHLDVDAQRELPGPLRVIVQRVPRGVEADYAERVAADADGFDVRFELADDARVGRHRPYLDVRVETEHGTVRHIFGGFELRVDAPLPPELRARAGGADGDDGEEGR